MGLESLRAPFVYCSAATREILLRLEKYHYRINFAQGKLESRNVTYDRSMRRLAKPLPLDTPTAIELAPGNNIQVTLIDANHCIGAVMFLIEGHGKAILYTGDIRAETWWVDSLVKNPILLPYTLGSRRLDCMYLDTTFATKSHPYREFQSKAEGIKELLDKVSKYPDDTVFYFHSWTFGYENVWIALSGFLRSRIHLDSYRTGIYGSLSSLDKKSLREVGLDVKVENRFLRESGLNVQEAPALCGFRNGNRMQPGCLTSRPDVRIHSCERGMGCPVLDHDKNARVVHIIPIVTRVKGTNVEIAELGAGGGKGDLDQKEELETGNAANISKIIELCAKTIKDEQVLSKLSIVLQEALKDRNGTIDLDMDLQKECPEKEPEIRLENLATVLSTHLTRPQEVGSLLNRTIRFPYSRHSSFAELCELVDAFRPKDVFPCTVDENRWDPELGMRSLFGPFCSGHTFRHDNEMMKIYAARLEQENYERRMQSESQNQTQSSSAGTGSPRAVNPTIPNLNGEGAGAVSAEQDVDSANYFTAPADVLVLREETTPKASATEKSTSPTKQLEDGQNTTTITDISELPSVHNTTPATDTKRLDSETPSATNEHKRKRLKNWRIAYDAALGINGLTWADYGGLVSARMPDEEEEL
ncbi:swr1 complex component [Didymosphaeria variabile]|uniref:Protein artemis n=1 Tax=Didymosphaeria variabile TaxID=1932322 RepID=A0A9W8XSJ4_9PLEO|nr:swr1 complex component [Didymosphaeria variabile]KAJ4358332.1 swr1 complex component [Didymosphaeria variabile]